MIAWMVYSVVVALVVAAAARAAEPLGRISGSRVRWIWAGAIMLTVFLSGSALVRRGGAVSATAASSPTGLRNARELEAADASWRGLLRVRLDHLRRSLDTPLRGTLASVRRAAPARGDVYAAGFASVLSIGLALIVVGVGYRFRKARRAWPSTVVQGVNVRVAPRVGPVVIGLVHPEIIVPQWLLGRHADDQRLVVTHEDEHIRARDPLLLGLAWAAAIIAPWNPLVWYMMSRLRLAVELDCDARVLRRGAAPRSYGSLLIDVAQQATALRLSALALADDSSHLHQRILAMKPIVPRFARVRAGVAAMFAFAGVLVACQATLPTDAEIERMDVASATRAAQKLAAAKHVDTALTYTVDGAKATSGEVSASERSQSAFTGLIFIDGVRSTESQMKSLRRDQIESVEVIKGAAAAALYPDPQAASGVITIKTKHAGSN